VSAVTQFVWVNNKIEISKQNHKKPDKNTSIKDIKRAQINRIFEH
jgi:hypothetical protein